MVFYTSMQNAYLQKTVGKAIACQNTVFTNTLSGEVEMLNPPIPTKKQIQFFLSAHVIT